MALRTSQRGRKPALTEEGKQNIRQCAEERPGITINEIREKLDLAASYSTVERAIHAFAAYLKDILLPTLHPGDIVVMDNLRSQHVKKAGELLEAEEVIPLYLPHYSPDLNPIEKMWSKERGPQSGL